MAAFGAQAALATKLRGLGDALDDVVNALHHGDALATGLARKLLAEWRELGEPLLWYPTEVRCAGKLVLAAELERAGYVLPAYQAGLRALMLTDHASAEDLLTLCDRLLRLQQGTLEREHFFAWLWSGQPTGLASLLGHAIDASANTVLEQPIAPDEIWMGHTTAATDEWNSLAAGAARAWPSAELQARFRSPALTLMTRIEEGDLLLDREETEALRAACDHPGAHAYAELPLLIERPELAALLSPEQAAAVVDLGSRMHAPLPALASCIERMKGASAPAIAPVLEALVLRGRADIVLPLWTTLTVDLAVRMVALEALRRDASALAEALRIAPPAASDPPKLHDAVAAARQAHT